MNEPQPWFPKPELLLLSYKSNKTRFHGLDHILRVWLYTQLISTKSDLSIDIDVLSICALFHEVGREKDYGKDQFHKEDPQTYLRDILPVLWPDISEPQIQLAKSVLANFHNNSTTTHLPELTILQDADLLDSRTTPLGKVDNTKLKLDVSKELAQMTNPLYSNWKYSRNEGFTQLETFRKLINNIKEESIKVPENLKKHLDEGEKRDLHEHFRIGEALLVDLHRSLNEIQNSLLYDKLTISQTDKIGAVVEFLETLPYQNDISTKALIYNANRMIAENIKIGLVDHGIHPRIRKSLTKLYYRSKKTLNSTPSGERSNRGLYSFLMLENLGRFPYFKDAFIQYMSAKDHYQENLAFFTFTNFYQKELIYQLLDKNSPIKLQNLSTIENEQDLHFNNWLWIRGARSLFSKLDEKFEENGSELTERAILYLIDLTSEIIEKSILSSVQTMEIVDLWEDIVIFSHESGLNANIEKMVKTIKSALSAKTEDKTIEGNGNINLCVFNQYDGDGAEASKLLESTSSLLITLCENGMDCEELIMNYLLPATLTKEFNYDISDEIIKSLNNQENIDKATKLLKLNDPNSQKKGYDIAIKYTETRSGKNIDLLLDSSKYHQKVSNKNGYKVLSNPIKLDIIVDIIEKDTTLLSSYNVLKMKKLVYEHPLNVTSGNYYSRIRYRDGLQRHMCIRRPNIMRDHPYYGMLVNENEPQMYLQFLSGNSDVLLVFKDDIAKKSIFTLHDAIWDHQISPVLLNEAKYLYEKVYDQKIGEESTFRNSYVEAGILGGVELEDVEKIIIKQKFAKKRKFDLEVILKKYPEVEVVRV